jgi:hypothetical protein
MSKRIEQIKGFKMTKEKLLVEWLQSEIERDGQGDKETIRKRVYQEILNYLVKSGWEFTKKFVSDKEVFFANGQPNKLNSLMQDCMQRVKEKMWKWRDK